MRNGTTKNIKTPLNLKYPTLKESLKINEKLAIEENLEFYDFVKIDNTKIIHVVYQAVD